MIAMSAFLSSDWGNRILSVIVRIAAKNNVKYTAIMHMHFEIFHFFLLRTLHTISEHFYELFEMHTV